MLHDHSGFDRDNPDAVLALEHALPVVADLLGAQRLPQPKAATDLAAWRDQIGELEAEVARIADRGGVEAATLRAAAERQLRRDAARPAAISAPTEQPLPTAPTFNDLAALDARLAREIAQLERDVAGASKALKSKRGEQRKLHRRLYGRGTRLG